MKKNISIALATAGLLTSMNLSAADSLETWITDGKVSGNVRYYFIETHKDKSNGSSVSNHSHAIGGHISYETAQWNGLSAGATFMTTNGFFLPDNVDTSTLRRDDGVRKDGSPNSRRAEDSFSVLGEAYVNYKYEDLELLYGRKVIKTPLIHAKDVRMIPSAVSGAFAEYSIDAQNTIEVSYLTDFKQRTSNKFVNIVSHALGDQTKEITGSRSGDLMFADYRLKTDNLEFKIYDYYAEDFFNSVYTDAKYSGKISNEWGYSIAGQYIYQESVGEADENLDKAGSATGGKQISANAYALKASLKYKEASFGVAYSKVQRDRNKHDSLIMPYDGTPLFTNTITSNVLFQSNYGKALTSDSIYIGGSKGVKLSYTQTYDFTGVKGFKTSVAYLNIDNSRFENAQQDFNLVLAYAKENFSLALKGIWINYNTTANATGVIDQDQNFAQYRVIGNYKF